MGATYPLCTSTCITSTRQTFGGSMATTPASSNSFEWRPWGHTNERPRLQADYVSIEVVLSMPLKFIRYANSAGSIDILFDLTNGSNV